MQAAAAVRPAPAVAFSRLPGAGGEEVGRLVAEQLDYGFFGREMVDQVADEIGVDHWTMRGLDERVRTAIERSLSDWFGRSSFSEDAYLRGMSHAIATLGERGGVVIVGRGAPFLLPAERTLRVLLVAPRATRLERYASVKQISSGRADAELTRAEQERSRFAERQFGVQQADPVLYDLVVNTGTLGFEGAAGLVVQALRLRFPA
jgi:cytidylate kinase